MLLRRSRGRIALSVARRTHHPVACASTDQQRPGSCGVRTGPGDRQSHQQAVPPFPRSRFHPAAWLASNLHGVFPSCGQSRPPRFGDPYRRSHSLWPVQSNRCTSHTACMSESHARTQNRKQAVPPLWFNDGPKLQLLSECQSHFAPNSCSRVYPGGTLLLLTFLCTHSFSLFAARPIAP